MNGTEMKELPDAVIYEQSLGYWPYKDSLHMVQALTVQLDRGRGKLLDIMCGPGYLLGCMAVLHRDLKLVGVDIDERYVDYGRATYQGISFEQGDVLNWQSEEPFDTVLCTGALHHVPYEQQETAIANMAKLLKPDGVLILSDAYVNDYQNEQQRQAAAAKLGYEYLVATIGNGAPEKIVEWTIDILHNDVLGHEFKTSIARRIPVLEKYFGKVRTRKVWPDAWPEMGAGYGDHIHVCTLT